MRIIKNVSLALALSVVMLLSTAIPSIASEVSTDKYTYTLSGKIGIQSDKIILEEYDDNIEFIDMLDEEHYEVILVENGAEIKFKPNKKMTAVVNYYTVDGEYAGSLPWTIDGSEDIYDNEIEANETATVKLYNRYGGYTCDLYYVFSFGDDDNATRIIYKVTDGTAKLELTPAEPTSEPSESASEPSEQVSESDEPASEPAGPASKPASQAPKKATALATSSKVLVDGKQVSFEAYNINNNNYFKLRDIAMAVNGTAKNFEVGWDSENKAIELTAGKAYTLAGGELVVSAKPTSKQATLSTSKVYLDGEEIQLTAYLIGGNNYFKLRDIGEALGIEITWDQTTKTIGIDTSEISY